MELKICHEGQNKGFGKKSGKQGKRKREKTVEEGRKRTRHKPNNGWRQGQRKEEQIPR